jgi:maltose 6'-phosphate phosphatase
MKNSFKTLVLGGLITVSFLLSSISFSATKILTGSAETARIKILTVNLLWSEFQYRNDRLDVIANFIAQDTEGIDVILLQEVVGGILSQTSNSGLDLKKKLARMGLNYDYSFRLANGIPGILFIGNAILSKNKLLFTLEKILPFVDELEFQGIKIPLKRKVIMCRINMPGFGAMNVYNVHLCSTCNSSDRLKQASVMMKFMNDVETLIWGINPIVLGGDFNSTYNDDVYKLITVSNNMLDTYAASNGNCGTCCIFANDLGCTIGAFGNPVLDPFDPYPAPGRIDYIFSEYFNAAYSSQVVFNSTPFWVSDHSGVLTEINQSTLKIAKPEGFDDFVVSNYENAPDGVVLFGANINNGLVDLSWVTESEQNNTEFILERSIGSSTSYEQIASSKTTDELIPQGMQDETVFYKYCDKINPDNELYHYRLLELKSSNQIIEHGPITLKISNNQNLSSTNFQLTQNYPNPFNPVTTIGYVLQEKCNAKLTMLNAIGEEIVVLVNEEQDKGYHKVEFDGSKLSSGVYFYRIQAGSFISTRKMLLLK